jgi:hypothetical protein
MDHGRINQRFITLHIHDQFIIETCGNLCQTVGTGQMIGSSHGYIAAEGLYCTGNTFIISGDDDPANGFTKSGTFIDPLYHRLAAQVGKRFSGEPG